MNASSSKTLVIALGGLGLLAVVAAANRQKKQQDATDADPELTPPGPPTPIGPLPSLPASNTQPPSVILQPPSLDPSIEPPGPPIPLPSMPLQPASLDPMIEPPGPPIPLPSSPSSSGGGSLPTYPVTVPGTPALPSKPTTLPSKRPFGDQPLEVDAGASNIGPSAAPTPAAKRSAKQAALDLLAYVTPILAAKRGSELGIKNQPNGVVKAAQIDMGDVPSDGIYGPRTRAKGTALTGKKFPPRV